MEPPAFFGGDRNQIDLSKENIQQMETPNKVDKFVSRARWEFPPNDANIDT